MDTKTQLALALAISMMLDKADECENPRMKASWQGHAELLSDLKEQLCNY